MTSSLNALIVAILATLALRASAAEPTQPQPANARPKVHADEKTTKTPTYIPKDLDDCFAELRRILPKDVIEKMKTGSEDSMVLYHDDLGMSLRNGWGLWRDSRLSEWFNERGVFHPDDMSGIIFDSFWRQLNGKPIHLDEQIKEYKAYWRKVELEEADEADKDKSQDIPANLDQCFAELRTILSEKNLADMKRDPESRMAYWNNGFGSWLRVNWGLWKNSRLCQWFNAKGVREPDDMSKIILVSFWRQVHGKPIQFDDQVKRVQEKEPAKPKPSAEQETTHQSPSRR